MSKLIVELDEEDKKQLFALMNKSFRERLPHELNSQISLTFPTAKASTLFDINAQNFEISSNYSDENYYVQTVEGEILENSIKI